MTAIRIAAFLTLAGCATTTPYDGPVAQKPIFSATEYRYTRGNGWKIERVLNIANPSETTWTVILDCEESHRTLSIPPRTVQHVLADPKDENCSLANGTP